MSDYDKDLAVDEMSDCDQDPFKGVFDYLALDETEDVVSTFPVWLPDDWPRDPDDPNKSQSPYPGCQRGIVFVVKKKDEDARTAINRFLEDVAREFRDVEA